MISSISDSESMSSCPWRLLDEYVISVYRQMGVHDDFNTSNPGVNICVFIKLPVTAQPDPVILILQCYMYGSTLWRISMYIYVCVCVSVCV